MSQPLVSVILPIYNDEKFLDATLHSLFSQDYTNFEIIAVDDCSTDNSYNILKTYNDSRLKVFKNDRNLGISKTTNKAFSYASGKYIMQQDHDDISLSNRMSLLVNFLETYSDIDGVSGAEKSIDNKVMKSSFIDKRDIIIDKDYHTVNCEQFFTGAFRNPTCMFKHTILDKLNKWYDEDVIISADMDFFERVNAAGFKWVTIKNIVLLYRKHNSNATKVSKNTAKSEFEKIVIKSIKRIMPNITDEQLAIHLKNAFRKGLFTKKEWDSILEWYRYLIEFNKSAHIFDTYTWYKVLSKHYMSAVIHSFLRNPFAGYKALFFIPELIPYYNNIKKKYFYEWQKKATRYWKYLLFGANK